MKVLSKWARYRLLRTQTSQGICSISTMSAWHLLGFKTSSYITHTPVYGGGEELHKLFHEAWEHGVDTVVLPPFALRYLFRNPLGAFSGWGFSVVGSSHRSAHISVIVAQLH